ncbi:unnamed protein product [Wuchereria bancrofti]|uniref:Uncharacterized protein n=1 Tax=Wuchereria bancrofti TaxID=6293 RepID=A0A3P7FVG1_WUCBA|nr:unnamed protein product [Wuchereria bancrofti]
MTNKLNHYTSSLSSYPNQQSIIKTELSEITEQKRQNILKSYANSKYHHYLTNSSSHTLRNSILKNEIQNIAISEADAYRPCGTTITTTTATNTNTIITDNLSPINTTRLPLAVKPLRQYQLKKENLHTSEEYQCNNTGTTILSSSSSSSSPLSLLSSPLSSLSSSSSLPRIAKTVPSSLSKTLCKTLSDNFRQNSQIISSNDIIKSKYKSETQNDNNNNINSNNNNNNSNNTLMKKFSPEIDFNLFDSMTTCIARPIYCDNEMMNDNVGDNTVSSLQKATTNVYQRTLNENGTKLMKHLLSNDQFNDDNNSMVDIKWEKGNYDNIKKEIQNDTTNKNSTVKSIVKIIKSPRRRLTIASSTINDWPVIKNVAFEKNLTNGLNINEKYKNSRRELPKKQWFSSSVDGPPIKSQQIDETISDDNLSSKQQSHATHLSSDNKLATNSMQKSIMLKYDSKQISSKQMIKTSPSPSSSSSSSLSQLSQPSQLSQLPPPKPTRTYEEMFTNLSQMEKSNDSTKLVKKSMRKTCPIVMGNTKMIPPKNYPSNSTNDSDNDNDNDNHTSSTSGFDVNLNKKPIDTVKNNSNVETSGKWLQTLHLPCDSYCPPIDEDDLTLSKNYHIRIDSVINSDDV